MATQLKEPEAPLETGQDEGQGAAQSQSAEDRAYVRGWRPEAEYTGSRPWVDAEAFLERNNENLGLSKAERQLLMKRISVLEGNNKKLAKLEQSAYENAMADIQAKMKNAVVTGDVATFEALDAKADKLRKDNAVPVADQQKEAIRAFAEWRDDNEWYDLGGQAGATDTERRQRAYFDRMVEANEDKAKGMAPADFIAHIGELVEAKYPASAAPRPKGTESVAGVTRTAASRSAKTGANLPTDAKDAVRRYMRQGIYKGTFEESCNAFAKDYDWSAS